MKTNIPPVDAAIEFLGGPSKASAALGIKNPSVVMNWKARGQVPADKVLSVEELTGISRHKLRPDIFGTAPKAGSARAQGLHIGGEAE